MGSAFAVLTAGHSRSIVDRLINKYAKYVIVSGFVTIAQGRSRGTEDVDIIIERIKKDDFIKMSGYLSLLYSRKP